MEKNIIELEECPICRGAGLIMHEGGWSVQVECADCSANTIYMEYSNDEEKAAKFLRREFNYTRFEQTLLLPDNIDRDAITAKAKHGVLKIKLPKLANIPEKEPTRVIEIQ
mgnify:CR=1 FL=1